VRVCDALKHGGNHEHAHVKWAKRQRSATNVKSKEQWSAYLCSHTRGDLFAEEVDILKDLLAVRAKKRVLLQSRLVFDDARAHLWHEQCAMVDSDECECGCERWSAASSTQVAVVSTRRSRSAQLGSAPAGVGNTWHTQRDADAGDSLEDAPPGFRACER
jgi:hypothetical protein